MTLRATTALLLNLAAALPLTAQDQKPAADKKAEAPADESLPVDLQEFYGEVTGKVVSVDATKIQMKVKVGTAKADPGKNKAAKPETLAGRTITVTALIKKGADGKQALDPASVAFIKGAKAGDPVTVSVRASSKGVVFRLLKVPAAAAE